MPLPRNWVRFVSLRCAAPGPRNCPPPARRQRPRSRNSTNKESKQAASGTSVGLSGLAFRLRYLLPSGMRWVLAILAVASAAAQTNRFDTPEGVEQGNALFQTTAPTAMARAAKAAAAPILTTGQLPARRLGRESVRHHPQRNSRNRDARRARHRRRSLEDGRIREEARSAGLGEKGLGRRRRRERPSSRGRAAAPRATRSAATEAPWAPT